MRTHAAGLWPVPILLLSLAPYLPGPAHAQDVDAVRQELTAVRRQLDSIREQYEQRLRELTDRLEQLEAQRWTAAPAAGPAPVPAAGTPGPAQPAPLIAASPAPGEAEPSLRPVTELAWHHDGLHLRLTGQGPWELDDLLALARSI